MLIHEPLSLTQLRFGYYITQRWQSATLLMNLIKRLFKSTVGRKYLMAISGAFLVFYVIGHMIGNLQIFLGRETINAYAQFLQSNKEVLWAIRLGMLTLIGLHIWSAAALTAENRAARPSGYVGNPKPTAASYASRTMVVSGLVVAAFIVFHLLHYTAQVPAVNFTGESFSVLKEPLRDGTERHDVFAMMVLGFRNPYVSLFYLVGVGLLCLHLSHGVRAMFQSLGLKNWQWGPLIDRAAPVLAWVLFLGYASIPIAVLLRIVGKEVLR
jgi:succinate dehydrogenase / fumarate reductase, cytochrome b subunit